MLILASQGRCYVALVQTDAPLPTGFPRPSGVCVMTFSSFLQGFARRTAPAVLATAMFVLVVAFATLGVVGVA